MEKVVFTDGDKIGVYDGGKTKLYDSDYILQYRAYAENRTKNDEWKYMGEGARFRGDYDTYRDRQEKIYAYINSVQWDGDKIIYSFTVNGSSGVRRKDIETPKAQEEHIISFSDREILSIEKNGNLLAVTVKNNGITSSIGTLDCTTSELKTYTEGDSRDGNAFFSTTDGSLIYFDSAGVGRTSDGEFTGKYAPGAICTLNVDTMEIEEIFSDGQNSYFKPKQDKDGALYCIQKPNKEKRTNPLVEMLLIPVRIVQAIVMFIQTFVVMFTGKSLTSASDNPTKGRNTSSRKLIIDGNLIEAEKEMKRNRRFKDKEYGFIPMSWKLVKIVDGKAEPIKSGICDFALGKDGIYCTNGKHIFLLKDGKAEKIADADMCLCVATENTETSRRDFFGF